MGKKYTFEDWKSGNIPQPPYPDDIESKEVWDQFWGPDREDNWITYWQRNPEDNPRITQEVANKIEKAQKEALETTLDNNVRCLMQVFLFNSKDASRKDMPDIIDIEINKNKKLLNEGLLQRVKQDRLNHSLITPEIYREMQEEDDYFRFYREEKDYDDEHIALVAPHRFELFAAAQTYRFISRLKELKKNILESKATSVSPWDKIDGTAKTCINLFLGNSTFRNKNKKIAKAFLVSFEIRAEEEYGKPHLGNKTETVRKVLDHSSFQYSKDSLSNRQLRDYLGDYWQNYRNPNSN